MTVAVVVPCRNEAAHIAGLLDALRSQTRPPNEVLIVNDQSTDMTMEVVRAWSAAHADVSVRVIEGPGRGPGPAMNAGIRSTDAGVIMRFDGHAIPARDYLERCLEVIGTEQPGFSPAATVGLKPDGSEEGVDSSKIGVVGGVWDVRPGADTGVARAIAAVLSHPLGSGGALYRTAGAAGPERVEVETVPFGTFPRALWTELGGFDESLAANQDFDFNYRARRAGYAVVLDRRIQATYFARSTLGALARQYSRYGFWKVQMLRKDRRALHWRQVPPAVVLPWVIATLVAAVVWPGWLTVSWAALYPLLVVAGALHIGITRSVNSLASVAAIATVHLFWSAGFWKALSAGAGRRPGRSRT